jgi:hypothetical protein
MAEQLASRVVNSKRWEETVNLERLHNIETVALGTRHHPINHGDCVEHFNGMLEQNNIKWERPNGLLNIDETRYIYTVNVKVDGIDGYCFSLGFVNYNDMSKSWTGLAGEYTFVCSNQMFRGEIMEFKRKHTTNVMSELDAKCQGVIENFNEYRERRIIANERMASLEFTDRRLADTVLNMHRGGLFGDSMIDKIVKEYDAPSYPEFKDRTALNFQNACTHVFKGITNPINRIQQCANVELLLNEACNIKTA